MKRRDLLAVGGAAAVLPVTGCLGYELQKESDVDELEAQLDERTDQLVDAEEELAARQDRIDTLEQKLAETSSDAELIEALRVAYATVKQSLRAADNERERAASAIDEENFQTAMIAAGTAHGQFVAAERHAGTILATCEAYEFTAAGDFAADAEAYAGEMQAATDALAKAADAYQVHGAETGEQYVMESETARAGAEGIAVASVESFEAALEQSRDD